MGNALQKCGLGYCGKAQGWASNAETCLYICAFASETAVASLNLRKGRRRRYRIRLQFSQHKLARRMGTSRRARLRFILQVKRQITFGKFER